MNLPKSDDYDRTHKSDANAPSWHMVNASFWTITSYEQFNSLVLESRRPCANSKADL